MENHREVTPSKYNFLVKREDANLVYNARKGTFTKVDDETLEILNAVSPTSALDKTKLDRLVEVGILAANDEIAQIKGDLESKRSGYSNSYSSFVVTPTMACNFACDYCDQNEGRKSELMSLATFERVVEAISVLRTTGKIELVWYGGEPLLAHGRLPEFSAALEKLKPDISRHQMITNGTLLDDSVCNTLNELGVTRVQISLDAFTYVKRHKRGVLMDDGQPSPILNGMIAAKKSGIEVSVRINADNRNAGELQAIKSKLVDYGFGEQFYLAKIEDFQGIKERNKAGCCAIKRNLSTMKRQDFAALERLEIFNRSSVNELVRKLTPKYDTCGATDRSMLVFSPDGSVSRCWNSVQSDAETITNIYRVDWRNELFSSKLSAAWDSYLPMGYDTCGKCKVLPLCMGGCSHGRLMHGDSESPCTPIKYYIDELVEYVGSRLVI
jgi:uncharacterized protein